MKSISMEDIDLNIQEREIMELHEIELLLNSFNQQASNIKGQLTDLLVTVSDGRVPTSEVMSTFNEDISELRKRYDCIYEAAQAIVLPDELPAQNNNVNVYVEAAKSSRIRIIQEHIDNARSILSKFVSVKSKIDTYSIALKPYQTAASDLLAQINDSTIEEILPETEAPNAFLAALEYENIGASSEGRELMQKISNAYNNDMNIYLGLATKHYYLSLDETDENFVIKSDHLSSDNINTSGDYVETNDSTASEIFHNPDTEQLITNVSEADLEENENESISEDENISDNITQTVNERCISATQYTEVTSLPSKDKISKAFRSIVGPIILDVIGSTYYITDDLIKAYPAPKPDDIDVSSILESLVSKGYLAAFEIEDVVYYCPTQMFGNCIRGQERSKKLQEIRNRLYPKNSSKRNIRMQPPLIVCSGSLTESQLKQGIAWTRLYVSIFKMDYSAEFCWSRDDQVYRVTVCDVSMFKNVAFVPNAYYIEYIKSHTGDVCTCDTNLPKKEVMESITAERCFCYTDCLYQWKENEWVKYEDGNPEPEEEITDTESEVESETIFDNPVCNSAADNNMNCSINEQEVHDAEINCESVMDCNSGLSEEHNTDVSAVQSAPTESVGEDYVESDTDNVSTEIKTETVSTPQELLSKTSAPSDEELFDIIIALLNEKSDSFEKLIDNTVNVTLFARGVAQIDNCPITTMLSSQIRLATNMLLEDITYTSDVLTTVFSEGSPFQNALMLSAYMFAMLTPGMPFDYGLINQTDYLFRDYEENFRAWEAFKPLFNQLLAVRDVSANGFTPAYIALLGNDYESKKTIQKLSLEANQLLTVQSPKTRMKALPIFYNDCFGPNSDLYSCMEFIVNKDVGSESLETMQLILTDFCDNKNDTFVLNDSKVEEYLSAKWASKNDFELEYAAYAQALRQFKVRINLMIRWTTHISTLCSKTEDIARLRELKDKLVTVITQIEADTSWKEQDGANILNWMLWYMQSYLGGNISNIDIFSKLLFTGYISLDETGMPVIDDSLNEVIFFEPWRNVLRHIIAPIKTTDEVKSDILGDNLDAMEETENKDNLHQLTLLGRFLNNPDEDYIVTDEQRSEAKESADERKKRFSEILELAYTYNQINETEKETLAGIMKKYEPYFYNIGDYANWRRFLEALEYQIKEYAKNRKKELRAKLNEKLIQNASSPLLLEAERLLEEDENFAVTEEYLTRFDNGETELEDELDMVLHDKNYFDEFLSREVFDGILTKCRNRKSDAVRNFGWNYVESKIPHEWSTRLREDSKKLISNWPTRRNSADELQMVGLMKGLGFDVINAVKLKDRKEEIFQLSIKPTTKSMADYRHPIAVFGTQAKPYLNVINLFGNYTERQLVDTVSSFDLKDISIVLMVDQPFDVAGRRYVGELFHTQTTGQNPFLLVDRVLFLYLSMLQETERLPAMLKCTLPYTTYQPFVRDGGSTADEMFCGRTQELATIIDLNGACVVYGGRQLGKTALLERAESRCSKPDRNEFAVYSTIIRIDNEADVVETLISDIVRKTNKKVKLTKCNTLKDMCDQIGQMFRTRAISTMHLLIDEVDCFLASIADDAYRPIQPLVDLRRETRNKFKFVLTGLHNVCRAKNATKDNGIFGQLGSPLCIKPLSPTDALKLLSRPLNYLGFQIDRYPHLETILTNTNYYPGILQFFGYMLVETLTGQYTKYYRATDGNPPFTLQDEQLGAVMNSADLNKSIKDKFRWSLELDPRYFMIARCITLLYHMYKEDRSAGTWMGFKVQDIFEIAEYYTIHCLEKESIDSFTILLDEMVDMGILSQPLNGVYRLRRSSFVDIIGESEEILENDINKYNEVNL